MFRLILVVSLVLQSVDVYMTVEAGGLVVESNYWAVLIWANFGIAAIVAVKLLSFAVFAVVWKRLEKTSRYGSRYARYILGAYFIAIPSLTVFLNALVIFSWRM